MVTKSSLGPMNLPHKGFIHRARYGGGWGDLDDYWAVACNGFLPDGPETLEPVTCLECLALGGGDVES